MSWKNFSFAIGMVNVFIGGGLVQMHGLAWFGALVAIIGCAGVTHAYVSKGA